MEDENGRKCLDEHLLARLAEARCTELHRLWMRNPGECVFYGVHSVGLLDVSHKDICVGGWEKGKRTWMSRWSDRQSSMMTASGLSGARTVERNFPPNMRIRGDSTDSTYS
jgi:hypothetical protein